ncbi:cilia- and flagella-associated protein 52 [Calliopsis andreniformis]|uniref:cilia- and flagella-associated protein 52 n=1 Tax=Calliopsis andreniformis TaxID=337506 RepID=UPI003FCC7DA9
MDVKQLELFGVVSFDGITRNSLWVHPDGEHLIYPMGNKITIKSIKTEEQAFLTGHRNVVSTLCVSPRGDLIASGQVSYQGFKAMVIIWNYEERKMKTSYEMHKVRVEHVCFTQDGNYLISLGGRDDGFIVVWDIENGSPLCGTSADKETYGIAQIIAGTNHNTSFVTAGVGTFRFWRIDAKNRKLDGVNVKIGKIKRTINCIVISDNDENIYCGTTSGDIIKTRLNIAGSEDCIKHPIMVGCYAKIPQRATKIKTSDGEAYAGGVQNLLLLGKKEKIIVGAGDGTVELAEISKDLVESYVGNKTKKLLILPCIVTHRKANVCATVTSMVPYNDNFILVGTTLCEIYEIEISSFHTRLLITCHTSPIYGLAFPRNRSEIFATSGKHDIRVWKLNTRKELLRITVPNFICSSLTFDSNGGTIISAWNDGAIRGFSLNGGNLLFDIERAHLKSVSVITVTHDDSKFISGGCDGQVRIWNAKSAVRQLLEVMKEHRGPITSLNVSPDDKSFISSSRDGTCIVWDVRTCKRKFAFGGSTMYLATCFVPSGVQVLTCGTDHKIAYWETLDGSLVREVEGSVTAALTAICSSHDGRYFLTGSDDSIIKLWDYRTAIVVRLGLAHAAPITNCAFSPDGKFIVTVSADSAIMIWIYPFEVSSTRQSEPLDVSGKVADEKASVSCSSNRSRSSSCICLEEKSEKHRSEPENEQNCHCQQ